MDEFIGKYQTESNVSAFDINDNKLVTCENNPIFVYNFN